MPIRLIMVAGIPHSMRASVAGLKRLCAGLMLCAAVLFSAAAWSQPRADGDAAPAAPATLLDLWFSLQDAGPVYPPYAFIRHRETAALVSVRKNDLLSELDRLVWHLTTAGGPPRPGLIAGLGQWQQRIRAVQAFRVPGQWGVAALMASPRNGVPIAQLAAAGACRVPGWVEIWSAQGVKRVTWRPAMRLSTLTADHGPLSDTAAQRVRLVSPFGRIQQRGIAAWNFQDRPLAPGARIVVPLPLDGRVTAWMSRHLARFLAHLLPGDQCREIVIQHETIHASR